jgi:aspartyl-tRNA(Asn)/glutamyl-tRNA(Gln) amidotransferase subunit B
MSDLNYKLIVGLEIHVQLSTKTKMFCACALEFAAEPNSRVCPVCMGMPGTLPVMNGQAYEYSVLTALALNCNIAMFTKWDRKSYYYPDLPKNYQISQYDLPMSSNGFIEIPLEGGTTKRIGIIRAHLEEDAGKNLHSGSVSQVDLNRAGTPLLEIVTAPDMNSPQEVRALAVELQKIVRYLGISEADMQKGHMRFEPNVNLHITKDGKIYKTPIAEIKNLNSFRSIERAVAYETQRQLDEFIETGITMETGNKTTRGWDDINDTTVLQREKEEAHDYRYFPDPDLLPVEMNDKWLSEIKGRLCELPIQKELRFVKDYKLSDYDAGVLSADRATAEFFEAILMSCGTSRVAATDQREADGSLTVDSSVAQPDGWQPPKVDGSAASAKDGPSVVDFAKRVCNLLTQVGLKIANEKNIAVAQLGLKPQDVAELAKMADSGTISATAAATILAEMVESSKSPQTIAQEKNLIQKSDAGELEGIVDEVLAANPQAVAEIKEGGKKSGKVRAFLMGQVIQKTKGQANPKVVNELLAKKLDI